jgi:hypothetical protein
VRHWGTRTVDHELGMQNPGVTQITYDGQEIHIDDGD